MTTPLFLLLFGLLSQRGLPNQPFTNNSNITTTPTQTTAALSCVSEIRWVNSNLKIYSLGAIFPINLFSAVGPGCAPAEIRVSAIYLDVDENVICSGVIENVATQDANTQTTVLEFKPLYALEFVRWRNRATQPIAKRLVCIGPDQLLEVSRIETDRAVSVRLYITLLPRNGGMSNIEIKVDPRH